VSLSPPSMIPIAARCEPTALRLRGRLTSG
jgi:hypothetical protein